MLPRAARRSADGVPMSRLGQSARLAQVQPPVIPIIHALIREYPDTISLGQGVVYYGPPPQTEEALRGFWEAPANHLYGAVWGIPPLRELLRAKLRAENGIRLDDERQLVVSAGGNMAFVNALLAIADPGDEIILISPYYFNHEMAVAMANCRPVIVPADAAYQLDLDAIAGAVTSRTRAVVSISPNNPTGAVYPEADLRALNTLCAERGIYHIHDEAYEYFTYDGRAHFSPGSLPQTAAHTISLFSLSKSYGFAGWRIGYMTIPADAVRRGGQGAGHGADLPAAGEPGGRDRSPAGGPPLLPAAPRPDRTGAGNGAGDARGAGRPLRAGARRGRLLRAAAAAPRRRPDDPGAPAGGRAPGGGAARHRLRTGRAARCASATPP